MFPLAYIVPSTSKWLVGVVVEPIWTLPSTVRLPTPPLLAFTDVVPLCDNNCKPPFEPNPIEPDLLELSSNLIYSLIPVPVLSKPLSIYLICRVVAPVSPKAPPMRIHSGS